MAERRATNAATLSAHACAQTIWARAPPALPEAGVRAGTPVDLVAEHSDRVNTRTTARAHHSGRDPCPARASGREAASRTPVSRRAGISRREPPRLGRGRAAG